MCVCVFCTLTLLSNGCQLSLDSIKEVFPGKDRKCSLGIQPYRPILISNSTLSSRITQHVFRFENCRQPSHPSLSIFLLSPGGSTAHISNSFASCINCELLIIMVRKYRPVVMQGKQLEY